MTPYDAAEVFGFDDGDRIPNLPIPEPRDVAEIVRESLDLIVTLHTNTGLEGDLEPLLWSLVNAYHRLLTDLERRADAVRISIKDLDQNQDGSEIASVELEKKIALARHFDNRIAAYTEALGAAVALFEKVNGRPWFTKAGGIRGSSYTAARLEGRALLKAATLKKIADHLPEGTHVVAFGDRSIDDHDRVWRILDRILKMYPDLVLHHPGDSKGFSVIAAAWANARQRPQVAWSPDFNAHGKSAAFKRNEKLLTINPILVLVFGTEPITLNLAQKAAERRISVVMR